MKASKELTELVNKTVKVGLNQEQLGAIRKCIQDFQKAKTLPTRKAPPIKPCRPCAEKAAARLKLNKQGGH